MAKPVKALGSIITIVIFFALIAVSTVLYSGDPEQQVKMEQNFFWRNAKIAVDSMWIAVQEIADIGLGKDTGGNTQNSDLPADTAVNDMGMVEKISSDIKDEWNKDGGVSLDSVSSDNLNRFIEWRRTDMGAEIIFKDKNGDERQVALPFKFLASQAK